jgi:hypothetical protein
MLSGFAIFGASSSSTLTAQVLTYSQNSHNNASKILTFTHKISQQKLCIAILNLLPVRKPLSLSAGNSSHLQKQLTPLSEHMSGSVSNRIVIETNTYFLSSRFCRLENIL